MSDKSTITFRAEDYLDEGKKVLAERGKQYDTLGQAERSMGKAVAAFQIITGISMTEAQGWEFMAVLKQVRLFQRPGFHKDSVQDLVNYAALCGEAKAQEAPPAMDQDVNVLDQAYKEVEKNELHDLLEKKAVIIYNEFCTALKIDPAPWNYLNEEVKKKWITKAKQALISILM